MARSPLLSASEVAALKAGGAPLMVFDCSFELMQPLAGDAQYRESHVAGAIRADLDRHLSAQPGAGRASGGRHPLPEREVFAAWLRSVGFRAGMQAVVYDRQGCNYCGRLWWMLRWAGHEAVSVLDGGLPAWVAAGGQVESGAGPAPGAGDFRLGTPLASLVDADHVLGHLDDGRQTVIDARGAPRYRGEVEPLDPVAGHIPGALNRPFGNNLGPDGRFKDAATLRTEFLELLAGRDPSGVVHQCGSGVSAVPNLIAMEIAGLGRPALYAGSWSDWCSSTSRPVATG